MISNELLKEKIILKATSGNLIENNEFLIRQNYKEIECHRFNLPQNWIWTTLEEIVDYKNGFAFNSAMMSKNNNGIPVIKSANIGKKKVIIDSKTDYIENPTEKMLRCIINKNDILMVLSSQSSNVQPLGISAIYKLETPALLNQRVLKLSARENINSDYLLYVINSTWFHDKLSNKAAGLAQANLKLDHVLSMEVPLPPLEEQERIVKKIEELFALIDKKERNDNEKEKLKTLLKEKILDSAIRGELVENNLSLPTVDVEEIKDNVPFEIPNNWKWSNFAYITTKISDGTHSTPKYVNNGIPFLSVKDISNGNLSFENCKYISQEQHKVLYSRCDPKYGDLLITKVGTTGVPVIVDTNMEFSLFVSVAMLRFDKNKIYNKYIKCATLSKLIQNQIDENTRGAANKNWVIKDIKKTIVPIPPLEQQKKIVEKIEKCFELIEQL